MDDKNAAEPDWVKEILGKVRAPLLRICVVDAARSPQEHIDRPPPIAVNIDMDVDLYRLCDVDTKAQTFVMLFGARPRRVLLASLDSLLSGPRSDAALERQASDQAARPGGRNGGAQRVAPGDVFRQ